MTTVAVLRRLLDPALVPPTVHTLRAWWDATAGERARWGTTIERALVGGVCADRLGFAFAGGYAEALRALVPGSAGEITALCATEEGGNHPRAIRTALTAAGPGLFTLTGKKKWATVASEASALLVVATVGAGDDGKNRLRVVRVPTTAQGVTLRSSSAPFVPEIPHAEVELDNVVITAADVLPGDGYDDYLKPFRTIEDLHVHGALLGYLIGVASRRSMPRDLVEPLVTLAIATCALAEADAKSEAGARRVDRPRDERRGEDRGALDPRRGAYALGPRSAAAPRGFSSPRSASRARLVHCHARRSPALAAGVR